MNNNWNDAFKMYSEAIKLDSKFELKGKTVPYTSSNGYMFSQLNKNGQVGIRLPKEEYEAFRKKHGEVPFKSYGAAMREYVLIPESLLKNVQELHALLLKGIKYVNSMPPAKTKK